MAGLTDDARRLLRVQCVLTLVVTACAFALWTSGAAAAAAAFGGLAAMLNSWLSGRRIARALEIARTQPGRETSVLFIGAVHRFVSMAAAFAVGIGVLALPPVPLLTGFAVVYGGIVLVRPAMPATQPDVAREHRR